MCSDYDFSTSQYGFIPNRGSDKATVLAHDVGVFANSCGSTVFYCSLDAEGAFDFLPHPVLLNKAMEVIPDAYWRCFLATLFIFALGLRPSLLGYTRS